MKNIHILMTSYALNIYYSIMYTFMYIMKIYRWNIIIAPLQNVEYIHSSRLFVLGIVLCVTSIYSNNKIYVHIIYFENNI